MVRALLAGRKTQTRRLATSPLRRVQPGDRLYVREAWSHTGEGVWTIEDARRHIPGGRAIYRATHEGIAPLRWWPSLHMPREFSRLTLIVEGVAVEPLQALTDAHAMAEGIYAHHGAELGWLYSFEVAGDPAGPKSKIARPAGWEKPQHAFLNLWGQLHTKPGERWEDNPHVVALSFRVVHGNIDQVPA